MVSGPGAGGRTVAGMTRFATTATRLRLLGLLVLLEERPDRGRRLR
jgi:hypothetical protein